MERRRSIAVSGFTRIWGAFAWPAWLAGLGVAASACARPHVVEAPPPPLVTAPPPTPEPAPAPVNVACKAKAHVCAEYQGVPVDDATKIRDKCASEGGQVLDACPIEKIAGTCTASRPQMTVRQMLYRAKTTRETRSLVMNGKLACESKGGVFTSP